MGNSYSQDDEDKAEEEVVHPNHELSILEDDNGDELESTYAPIAETLRKTDDGDNDEAKSEVDDNVMNDENKCKNTSSVSSPMKRSITDDDDHDDQIILFDVDEEEITITSEKSGDLDDDKKNGNNNKDKTNGTKEERSDNGSYNNEFQIGYLQILALLRKNLLTKRRTAVGTFFELFSPLLMMLILAAAFSLSDITYKDAKHYVTTTFEFPGPWLDLLQTFQQSSQSNNTDIFGDSSSSSNFEQRRRQRQRRGLWSAPSMKSLYEVDDDYLIGDSPFATSSDDKDWNDIMSGLQDRIHHVFLNHQSVMTDDDKNVQGNDHHGRALQFDDDDDDSINSSIDADGSKDGANDNIYDFLNDARNQLSKVLKGPMIVPSFDQFVSLSLAFSQLIDSDNLPPVFSDSSFGRQWGNILTLGTIHLSPNNNLTNSFWYYLNTTYPNLMLPPTSADENNSTILEAPLKVRIHSSENDALHYIDNNLEDRTWALLNFANNNTFLRQAGGPMGGGDDDLVFKIRMNYTTVPNTNEITNWVSIGLNIEYQMYYLSGYLTIQRTINEFAFSRTENCTNTANEMPSLWSIPMPTAAYSQNPFFLEIGYLLGLTITMAFLFPVSRLIKTIVEEKESRMKETLFILGVRPWAHWWSWFLTALGTCLIITISVTVCLTLTLIKYSNPLYIFAFVGLFSTSNIGFCFTIASLFSRAKLSAIVGPLALFGSILPRFIFFGFNRYEATTGKMWSSLLPATAFAFGADILGDYEYSQQGIQAWNVQEGGYSFQDSLRMMLFDTFLYIFLGWYLDQVMPRQYGVPRPFYFLFTPDFWFGKRKVRDRGTGVTQEVAASDKPVLPGVQIKNLVKRHANNNAVDGLDLTLYESQITTLLGHNGAGKSSTVSVLTGLYPPTSGDCVLYGKSIVHDMTAARQSIGLVPQQDQFFDSLTVIENLSFFQRIKGIRPTLGRIEAAADEIDLTEYLRTAGSALSGGNKRKLSVAIALIGDPKVLILDEPTSRMDPRSRRAVWELLRRKRTGRVTLLTTHFMDEADLLSDTVAILAEGKLLCCGSPSSLKQRFGLGYTLTVVLDPTSAASDEEQGVCHSSPTTGRMLSLKSRRERLSAFLKQQIPIAECKMSGREMKCRFEYGSEELFPGIFDKLEVEKEYLGISAYGVTNCSLEEVFIRASDGENFMKEDSAQEAPSEESTDGESNSSPVENNHDGQTDPLDFYGRDESQHLSPIRQVGLLYQKRLTIQKRDVKGFAAQIVLPVLTILFVLLILTLEPPFVGPAIAMSPLLYEQSETAKTNVLVGGDSDVGDGSLQAFMTTRYQNIDYNNLGNTTTSAKVSKLLLDTYNDRSHHTRFGAYVFDDLIHFKLRVGLDDISELWTDFNLNETSLIESPIDWEVSVLDLSADFYDLTNTSPDMAFNATDFLELTERALQNVFATGQINSNSSLTTDEWSESLKGLINSIQAVVVNGFNGLSPLIDLDPDIQILEANIVQLIEGNATMEEIVGWVQNTTASQWGFNVSQSDVEYLTGTLFANLTPVTDFNSSSDELSAWANNLHTNFSMYVGNTWAEASEYYNEFANIAAPNLTELVKEFLEVGQFDRGVVEREMEYIIYGMIQLLAVMELDAPEIVASNFIFIDGIASVFNDSVQDFELSNNMAVSQIILANSVLTQVVDDLGQNATSTLGDFFGSLSKMLGGTDEALDGSMRFQASSIGFDPSSLTLSLSGIRLESLSESFIDIENVTVQVPISGITDVLSNDTMEFRVRVEGDTVLHNTSSPHAVAAFNQAYMEHLYGTCKANQFTKLVSINEPLPLTTQQSLEVRTILSVLAALFLLIPLGYIPAAFVVFLVRERASKSKHLQLVSGLNMTSYWVSSYLWDLTLYLILTFCVMLVFLIYGNESAQVFVGDTESFSATFFLLFGYGMSILPFAYLLSRKFTNPSTAQISVIALIFVTGFVAVNAYFIMSTIETTQDLAESLLPLFRMWPAYNVGEGMIRLSRAFWEREVLGISKNAFEWDVAGRSIMLVYALAPVYFAVLLLLEYTSDGGSGGVLGRLARLMLQKVNRSLLLVNGNFDEENELEEDVANEAKFVKDQPNLHKTAPVVLKGLWKLYPPAVGTFGFLLQSLGLYFRRDKECNQGGRSLPKLAVRGLTTAVEEGEIFGLLGSNGAGKTSTLGILTGDIAPTSGEAFVAGHDVSGTVAGGVAKARQNIGFCPQIDPLLDLMTGRETLTMFARLRGISDDRVAHLVNTLLELLTLTPHADKNAVAYSGGNKRKLSLGIAALVGDGGVLMIDESSSGMDPIARRKLWDLIQQLSEKRSVILTTHSMEEAEALCTRIGVMVSGQFVAIGTIQHLKSNYLDCYTLDINCEAGTSNEMVDSIASTVLENVFPGSKLSERHGRYLKFEIARVSALGLGTAFRRLQELMKDWHDVEDYSVAQCSLEQVFIKLVNESVDSESSNQRNTEKHKNERGCKRRKSRITGNARRDNPFFITSLCLFSILGFMIQTSAAIGPSTGNVLDADELLVGNWNLKLQGMFGFDLSQLFPSSTTTKMKRRRRSRSGPMNCNLSIYPNGTFAISPTTKAIVQESQQRSTTAKKNIDSIMPIRGQWHVLANPYCVTDRSYDQVVLESYPRIKKRQQRLKQPSNKISMIALPKTTTRTTTTTIDDRNEEEEVIKISFSCRMWGRYNRINGGLFGLWRPNYSRGRITHGTLVWQSSCVGRTRTTEANGAEDGHLTLPLSSLVSKLRQHKSKRQRRSIVASFKGSCPMKLESSNQGDDFAYESEDIFGY